MQQVSALGKRPHIVVRIVDPINVTFTFIAKDCLVLLAVLV
jgi:hypothetical protein